MSHDLSRRGFLMGALAAGASPAVVGLAGREGLQGETRGGHAAARYGRMQGGVAAGLAASRPPRRDRSLEVAHLRRLGDPRRRRPAETSVRTGSSRGRSTRMTK